MVGQSPFNGTDEDELLWNVCYEKLVYPLFLSAVSKDLVSKPGFRKSDPVQVLC
ncbi:protein kinase C-like 1 [Leptotrombidium deliense]|uniref:Protein kinase C-like 1 n=1 Tax=Leptotrombidium deliense TaxID=299467 RepID=A0A443S5L6_9ACAR|nr:protein kinase C-like 1 [Leptotrombidium deliense]